jgi:hypothetical protein
VKNQNFIGLVVVLVVLTALGAQTVKPILYTDKPNAVPIGSDFFSLQRNNDFINASVSQVKVDWFNNPVFTGNGGIQGNWRVDGLGSIGGLLSIGGIYYGNGAGLTNVPGISGNFFAATNGVGQNPTFYGGGTFFGVYFFDEGDFTRAFLTNVFINYTNSLLSTDGNGQPTNAGTSARFTFTGNVLDIASASIPNADLVNSSITIQGSSVALGGSTLAAGSSPSFNGINFTNLGYGLPTNNVGGAAFVFGGPGTAATLYDTNITAATTLKLFDITACGATAGGFKLYCTCSGGTDRILTFPAGCSGAGLGTPPAVTITNAKGAFFDVIYKPGATPVTNVFWSPVY